MQTEPGEYFCGDGGVCVEPTSGSSTNAIELPSPTIELVGPETVYIEEGDAYLKCPTQAPLDVVCDAGAFAFDSVEGDITAQVRLHGMHTLGTWLWRETDAVTGCIWRCLHACMVSVSIGRSLGPFILQCMLHLPAYCQILVEAYVLTLHTKLGAAPDTLM